MQAQREEEVLAAGIPSRETQVYHASNTPTPSPASLELPLSYSSKVDAEVLKNAFRETRLARNRQDRFQTKAMRDFEFLKGRVRSSVHTKATLKIQFPDGWVLSANFSPLEKLTDVEAEIKRSMRNPQKAPFYLFERPRNERLVSDLSLAQLGFVPSTKLFAAWDGQAPEGDYFRDELVVDVQESKSGAKGKSVSKSRSKRKSIFKLFSP